MKFSCNWLKEIARFKENPSALAEFLTLNAFEVEGVEKTGSDWAIDISGKTIGPRMADAGSHVGLGGEIAALKGTRIKHQRSNVREDGTQKAPARFRLIVESADDCPRYTARVMKGVRMGESPAWLRARLETCGLQPINNLVDAANYVMLEVGQPLHVFDFEKLSTADEKEAQSTKDTARTIVVRRAKKGERITTLDDKIYDLTPEILVIGDQEKPIAIAGVKGGKDSGVSRNTTTVILESANFSPALIHRASQELNLRTDASYRFSHGLDPNQTEAAVDRLAALIQQLAGGTILKGRVDAYPKKFKPQRVLYRPSYAERLIGTTIPKEFQQQALERIGCSIKTGPKQWIVTPPTVRMDLAIEEDLVEEIARQYGLKQIPAILPPSSPPAERNDAVFYREIMRDILVGTGFTEAHLYAFTGERELAVFGLTADDAIPVENPTAPETAYLTPRALIKYVAAADENLKHRDVVRLFGFAKSFQKPMRGGERENLVIALAEKTGNGVNTFYQLKGTVDHMLESLGISDHWYDDAFESGIINHELGIFHPYRVAEVKVGTEKIGVIGEIHPVVLERFKAKSRIVAAEIDFEALMPLLRIEQEFRPIARFPAIVRDIAIVVPAHTRILDVQNTIESAGGNLLIDVDLFDDYTDATMREREERSLAFHLVFQSPDRTLTDTEADKLLDTVIKTLEDQRWTVRN